MQKNISRRRERSRFILIIFILFLLWIMIPVIMDLNNDYLTDKTALRYGIYFGWLFAVALVGYYFWKSIQAEWVRLFWVYTYVVVAFALLVSGIVDLFIYPFNHATREAVQNFRLFFMSPVAFVVLNLFYKLGKEGKEQKYS